MPIRKLKHLAADLGICERQFHRRLDTMDPAACLALRQELLYEHGGTTIPSLINSLVEMAALLRRCDPALSRQLATIAGDLNKLNETTAPSPWRVEWDRRLSDGCNRFTDEEYSSFAEGPIMPPEVGATDQ